MNNFIQKADKFLKTRNFCRQYIEKKLGRKLIPLDLVDYLNINFQMSQETKKVREDDYFIIIFYTKQKKNFECWINFLPRKKKLLITWKKLLSRRLAYLKIKSQYQQQQI